MFRFKAKYFEPGDVLYTYLDQPEEATNDADDFTGLIYRTSTKTGKPCGVTVLDLKHTYSSVGGDALCFNIQHFLKEVTIEEIEAVVYPILGYKT